MGFVGLGAGWLGYLGSGWERVRRWYAYWGGDLVVMSCIYDLREVIARGIFTGFSMSV